MKKLSLLLISLFVCSMSWAQVDPNTAWKHANPYAYDMQVSYSSDLSKINFTYTMNDNAIDNSDVCKEIDTDGLRGIKIYFYDKDGNKMPDSMTEFVPGAKVIKGTYTFSRNASLFTKDQPYTWVVETHGNQKRTKPDLVTSVQSGRPKNAYGIAINNIQSHTDFGKIYVSEAYKSSVTSHNSLLLYSPMMTYVGRHDEKLYSNNKVTEFSNVHNREPNRVKVSGDGRVFLTSYNPTGTTAVWEYMGAQKFQTVIYKDASVNKVGGEDELLARRVIGMDVIGKDKDLKVLLAWIDANGYNGKEAKVEIYEYALGAANMAGYRMLNQIVGQEKTSPFVRKIAEYNCDKVLDSNAGGLLYQSFVNDDCSARFGFVDVAYDSYGNVWMKVDYAHKTSCTPGKIVWFKNDGSDNKEYVLDETRTDGFYGGGAVIVVKDQDGKDVLFTGTGSGRIQGYDVDANGNFDKRVDWVVEDNTINTTTRIGRWVTGFALDCVNNLHAVTEASWTEGSADFTANILTIALPYSGYNSTISSASSTFVAQNTNPIPNILATDLRYSYNRDRSVFSFNVNTKPKLAQIRFYDSKANMLNSVNTVHADLYDGSNIYRPSFVYNVPESKLKQGNITIELGMCCGKLSGAIDSEGCEIINDSLPAGEWYWSVYVEAPRRSTQFGVMARVQGTNDATNGMLRGFATVNNYPETDMFGSIIMAVNPSKVTGADDKRTNKGLYILGINDNGNSNDEKANIESTTRFGLRTKYLNANMTGDINDGLLNYPRRLTVAPDGKVYIADIGLKPSSYATPSPTIITHNRGGVKMWDPAKPNTFKRLSTNILGTATDVAIYQRGSDWRLYATNTYDEGLDEIHGRYYTGSPSEQGTKDQVTGNNGFGKNGYVEYLLNSTFSSLSGQTQRNYKKGDGGGGNMDIVAMDKGVWFSQGRNHTVKVKKYIRQPLADCLDTYLLAFMPYGTNEKTWTSCTNNGVNDNYQEIAGASALTQKENSPLQANPGGGLAYRKYKVAGGQKEYLYLPNHDGNIARLEITSWSGNKPTIPAGNVTIFNTPSYMKMTHTVSHGGRTTTWNAGFIMTMEFDYAGNLVTVAGKDMFSAVNDIIVYTMPYPDRVNAQEIQAPMSCVFIPERLSQVGMNQVDIDPVLQPYIFSNKTCSLDIYRPLQEGSFNTICLPFNIEDLSKTPYAGATVMEFVNAEFKTVGEENMLYFNFREVTSLEAGKPYLLQPVKDIYKVQTFTEKVLFSELYGKTLDGGEWGNFIGIFPQTYIDQEPGLDKLKFMLVADNRLAEIEPSLMYGFRAYFQLKQQLTPTTKMLLNFKKDTSTDVIIIDGKKVDIEKYLRDGRVYIRAGETLYTITGEVVGDRR